MANNTIGKYTKIWRQIKLTGKATIVTAPWNIATVKKAVIAKKYEDIGFKVELDMARQYARLDVVVTGNKVEFKLVIFMRDIELGDM